MSEFYHLLRKALKGRTFEESEPNKNGEDGLKDAFAKSNPIKEGAVK